MELINISEEQIERAKKLYSFKELRGSITKGEGNLRGALGDFNSTFDYDLIIDGHKIDVKTKATNYKPIDSFNCSIPAAQKRQKCDYYFFTYITYDYKQCYLAGYKSKESFFKQSTFAKEGEIDFGNWKYKSDCYNLRMKNLNKFTNEV